MGSGDDLVEFKRPGHPSVRQKNRKQTHRLGVPRPQQSSLVLPASLKHLVGVHPMRPRHRPVFWRSGPTTSPLGINGCATVPRSLNMSKMNSTPRLSRYHHNVPTTMIHRAASQLYFQATKYATSEIGRSASIIKPHTTPRNESFSAIIPIMLIRDTNK